MFYRISGPHYRFQQIRDVFFILSGVLKTFFHKKKVSFLYGFLFFCVSTHRFHPLKPISGPCSIEIMYPCEWRIAIPASLMRVENLCILQILDNLSAIFLAGREAALAAALIMALKPPGEAALAADSIMAFPDLGFA